MLTEVGEVELEVPRDRDGSFEPKIVRKRQRRMSGVDELVISLSAKGLTTGEVAAHLAEVYGATVSKDTNRPDHRRGRRRAGLLAVTAARPGLPGRLQLTRVHVKIRDGKVINRPISTVVGVTVDGERDILGLWVGDGGEGAKHLAPGAERDSATAAPAMSAPVVCDGLRGLPEAIADVWPQAIVQTCVLHLIRNTFRYASKADWPQLAKDLRPVYGAATETAAAQALDELTDTWAGRYPAIIRLWQNAWAEFEPLPRLQPRDPQGHLLHERDRKHARPLPPRRPRPRPLSAPNRPL